MVKDVIFRGCGTAIVTPFTNDEIDYFEYQKLIEFQIKNNCDAIIVCGTTGESATLSLDEKKELIEFTVATVKNRIPVIAGTGSNNTKISVELSKFAEEVGCNGLLLVTPYYNKTTQNGLVAHYSKISNASSLPIILYNVPSRTGLNILPETCLELSKIDNIVAVKEASGNVSQIAKIASICEENLHIYSGNDDQIVPILSLGGIGAISVLSNAFPNYVHSMIQSFFDKEVFEASNMQLNAMNLIENLFTEVNPIPIKEVLNMMNFNVGNPRLPLINMSEDKKRKLEFSLENFQASLRNIT